MKKKEGKIYWAKTEGKIAAVKNILTVNTTQVIEQDLIDDKSTKIKLICGEPGQGKSVVLSHIARSIIAQGSPHQWVVQIDLVNLSQSFDTNTNDLKSKENSMEFLLQKCLLNYTKFEKAALQKNIQNFVLILDGVDEISPCYKKQCIAWIQGFAKNDLHHIWVSTRSHLQEELENEFSCLAYCLDKFDKNDKVNFLVKFFKKNENSYIDKEVEIVAYNLLDKFSNEMKFNGGVQSLIGIPLILTMVAEIYFDEATEILKNKLEPSFKVSYSLVTLYNAFIKKKFKVYMKKNFAGAGLTTRQTEIFFDEHEQQIYIPKPKFVIF